MTPEQFDRLPKYARERIGKLERELDIANEKVRRMNDTQTETKIWVEDYGASLEKQREYVQGEAVVIAHAGVCLRVNAYNDRGIELSWAEGDAPYGTGEVAFIPTSHQQARLTAVDNLYVWPKVKRVKKKVDSAE